jgi:hypothetical protein
MMRRTAHMLRLEREVSARESGKLSWLLVVNEDFFAHRMSLEELRRFVEEKVIKKVHQNPGKRIQISKYRDITVEEKNIS